MYPLPWAEYEYLLMCMEQKKLCATIYHQILPSWDVLFVRFRQGRFDWDVLRVMSGHLLTYEMTTGEIPTNPFSVHTSEANIQTHRNRREQVGAKAPNNSKNNGATS